MLFNLLLDEAASNANQNGGGGSNWVLIAVFGVMMVGMILLMILPNKKRQKEYQKMQNEIRVGTKIMTIGRMVGTVTKIYPDNTLELDVGTPGNPVIITITREAIGVNMTAQEEMKAQQEAMKNKKNGAAQKNEVKDSAENAENVENVNAEGEASETASENQAETSENNVTTTSNDDDAI